MVKSTFRIEASVFATCTLRLLSHADFRCPASSAQFVDVHSMLALLADGALDVSKDTSAWIPLALLLREEHRLPLLF